MSRRPRDPKQKQGIAIRLQRLIEEKCGTYYAFRRELEERDRKELASTVRGWLPPQKRWKEKPDGRAMRPVDWKMVKLPDVATLIELCDLLQVRADYLLFGHGSPYRGQSRDDATLEKDLEARIWRDAHYEVETHMAYMAIANGARPNTRAMLKDVSRWARDDVIGWAVRLAMRRERSGLMSDPEVRAAYRREKQQRETGIPAIRAYYVTEPPKRTDASTRADARRALAVTWG
jgi:hypothetical protein